MIVGVALTVTIAVVVQPLLFVYVIVLVPPPTPVTTPALSIVATVASLEVHAVGAAGVAEPIRPVVPPTHTVKPPVIIGVALTVSICVAVLPLLSV